MQNDNPYLPPRADLTPVFAAIDSAPPFPSRLLRIGAWMSVVQLLLLFPYSWVSFDSDALPPALTVALGLVNSFLPVVVMYTLVRYLEFRYQARNLRTLFYVITGVGLIFGLLGIPMVLEDSDELSPLFWTGLLGLPLFGVPYALLGHRIKRLAEPMSPVITLGWLMILIGWTLASLVLAPIAMVLNFAYCWVAAKLLFASAREIAEAGYP